MQVWSLQELLSFASSIRLSSTHFKQKLVTMGPVCENWTATLRQWLVTARLSLHEVVCSWRSSHQLSLVVALYGISYRIEFLVPYFNFNKSLLIYYRNNENYVQIFVLYIHKLSSVKIGRKQKYLIDLVVWPHIHNIGLNKILLCMFINWTRQIMSSRWIYSTVRNCFLFAQQ